MKKRIIVVLIVFFLLTIALVVINFEVQRHLDEFFSGFGESVFGRLGEIFTAPKHEAPDIKTDSQLFVTLANASAVNQALLKLGSTAPLPNTSVELTALEPKRKVDAWGHPFCITETSSRFVIISLGSDSADSSGCAKLSVDLATADTMPIGVLNRLPSGKLALVSRR